MYIYIYRPCHIFTRYYYYACKYTFFYSHSMYVTIGPPSRRRVRQTATVALIKKINKKSFYTSYICRDVTAWLRILFSCWQNVSIYILYTFSSSCTFTPSKPIDFSNTNGCHRRRCCGQYYIYIYIYI